MDYSISSPFIRVFYGDLEVSQFVEDLKYTASEEEDDECTLTIRSEDRSVVDQPYFQERVELKVLWGFMGTPQIATRIVVIEDLQWQYDKSNVTGTVVCTEKGAKIKFSSSDTVYRNSSLLGVANSVADKHGLKLEVEIPSKEDKNTKSITVGQAIQRITELGDNLAIPGGVGAYLDAPPIKIPVTGDLLKQMQDAAAERREIDSVAKILYGVPYSVIKEESSTEGVTVSLDFVQRQINFFRFFKDMKNYPFIAQGNKTDRQLLTELGMKEKDGPFVAETRDDKLIIRRRNWNKTPYKSYEYGGSEGTFLEFNSDPKNRTRKQSALNMGFGNWDPINKTYMEGNTNAVNDTTRSTLSKYEELYENYKILAEKYPNAIVDFQGIKTEVGSPKGFLSSNILGSGSALSDETRVVKELKVPIYAIDKLKILEQTLNEIKGITPNKKLVDTNNDGIVDAYDQASNLRNQSELKRNPFTAKFYGDVGIWPGEILTLLGLGNKYSGNYYVTKVHHAVSPQAGYLVSIELIRKGANIKSGDSMIPSRELGKGVNTQIGSGQGQTDSKVITVKQNPR